MLLFSVTFIVGVEALVSFLMKNLVRFFVDMFGMMFKWLVEEVLKFKFN